MDIYFRTDKSIVKMNDILEVTGNFLVVASLDRTKQCVLMKYSSAERAQEVLNNIDIVISGMKAEMRKTIIIEVPKE